jgi:hypothetical protein
MKPMTAEACRFGRVSAALRRATKRGWLTWMPREAGKEGLRFVKVPKGLRARGRVERCPLAPKPITDRASSAAVKGHDTRRRRRYERLLDELDFRIRGLQRGPALCALRVLDSWVRRQMGWER